MVANLSQVYKDKNTSELLPIVSKNKHSKRMKSKTREDNPPTQDCGCHSGGTIDWCAIPTNEEYCKTGGCKEKHDGCGWFLEQSCDGLCTLDGL